MSDLTTLSIRHIRDGLKARRFSVEELLRSYLGRIDEREREVQGFLHLDREGAIATAQKLDAEIAQNVELPPLFGVVVAVKDNIAVRGMPATAASRILESYHPPYEATVVERLRSAGAIIIGKTNLDEFAMGASTEHSAYHPTRNPHDPGCVPGGSSGGSAAAVAAGFCTAAIGSDTGGSIRQPAAFCGIVGLRPSYGRVSRYGLIALASSMDVIGPIARSVEDARTVFAVIVGHDRRDATTMPLTPLPSNRKQRTTLRGLRVGIPREYVAGDLSDVVRTSFDAAVELLRDAGARVIDLSLPTTEFAVPTYYVITPAEASSNLARYDGLRFGQPANLELGHGTAYARLRGERFGPEPKRRILLGTYTLSAGYADRYYHTAQRVRTLIRQDFVQAFESADVLLTPTTPTPAFPLGSIADPVTMYRQDVFLAAVSLAGLPALSLPVSQIGGLPVGVQCIGRQGEDDDLLEVAELIEGIFRQGNPVAQRR